MRQVAQRQIGAAAGLVVVDDRLVVAVERVLQQRLQLEVREKSPGGTHIERAVAAHALRVGGILIARATLEQCRTDAEGAQITIDIQPRDVLSALRQELAIIRASVARIEQGDLELRAPPLQLCGELDLESPDAGAVNIVRTKGRGVVFDQVVDLSLIGIDGPGEDARAAAEADLCAARSLRPQRRITIEREIQIVEGGRLERRSIGGRYAQAITPAVRPLSGPREMVTELLIVVVAPGELYSS